MEVLTDEQRRTGKRYLAKLYDLYVEDRIGERSAALAFHAMIALVPLVAFAVFTGSLLMGERVFVETTLQYIEGTLGSDIAQLFSEIFERLADFRANYYVSFIGVAIVLYGASNFFLQLRSTFSGIYHLQLKEESEGIIRATVVGRMFALVFMVLLLALFLLTFLAHMVIVLLFELSNELLLGGIVTANVAQTLGVILSFTLALFLFSGIYRFVGGRRVKKRSAFVGGLAAALIFTILNALFSIVLTKSAALAAYGVAGSLVAFILWLHYIIQGLLIGAEITKLANRRHHTSRQ